MLRGPRNIRKELVMEVGLGFEEARGDWGVGPFKFGKAICVSSRTPSKVAIYVVNLVEEEVICRSAVTL